MIHVLLLLVAIAAPASSGQTYDLAVNGSTQFLVQGDPTVDQWEGVVDVDVETLGAGLYLVQVHCVSSTTGRCMGEVSGQEKGSAIASLSALQGSTWTQSIATWNYAWSSGSSKSNATRYHAAEFRAPTLALLSIANE